jgi:hypothetical protein
METGCSTHKRFPPHGDRTATSPSRVQRLEPGSRQSKVCGKPLPSLCHLAQCSRPREKETEKENVRPRLEMSQVSPGAWASFCAPGPGNHLLPVVPRPACAAVIVHTSQMWY